MVEKILGRRFGVEAGIHKITDAGPIKRGESALNPVGAQRLFEHTVDEPVVEQPIAHDGPVKDPRPFDDGIRQAVEGVEINTKKCQTPFGAYEASQPRGHAAGGTDHGDGTIKTGPQLYKPRDECVLEARLERPADYL